MIHDNSHIKLKSFLLIEDPDTGKVVRKKNDSNDHKDSNELKRENDDNRQ